MTEISSKNITTQIGLDDLLSNIALAKNNENILGIYLFGGELSVAPASAKALRDALVDFKESGKFIIAYSDTYSQTNYYIASVADKICLNTVGSVAWNGMSAQKMYFTNIMKNIGIEMQILKVGTFKSAVEPYFRTSMSAEDRKQTEHRRTAPGLGKSSQASQEPGWPGTSEGSQRRWRGSSGRPCYPMRGS